MAFGPRAAFTGEHIPIQGPESVTKIACATPDASANCKSEDGGQRHEGFAQAWVYSEQWTPPCLPACLLAAI
jgi:hypothetical protein